MLSWLFSPGEREYRQFGAHLRSSIRQEASALDWGFELKVLLTHGLNPAHAGPRPRLTGSGLRIYTPRQLEEVVSRLRAHEPMFAAYLLLDVLPQILPCAISHPDSPLTSHELPISFQGDLMMALEKIRAVAPEQTEQGVRVLANALCMMASLKRARETYGGLGAPYTDAPLSPDQLEKVVNEKFVPEATVTDLPGGLKRLAHDETIRRLVRDKLRELNPKIALLVAG